MSTSSSSSSFMIATIIIASAVIISCSVYLLLRLLAKRCRHASSAADDVVQSPYPEQRGHVELLESLPLFTFGSVTRNLNGGDCAVCLSKFEPNHQLRLLPLCCHAFHAACIDTWIVSNQTCPLCRSTVRASDCASALHKFLSADSFRIELGSISRRAAEEAGRRRTYSLGSLEYVVDDCVHEVVSAECTISNSKEEAPPVRNWLREYLTSISSRTVSFRSSSRYFSSEAAVVPVPEEVNRAGEEISEAFRWLSGI